MVCPTLHELICFIMPLAVAFAAATVLSNAALSYSSIAYVQIIGSTAPVVSAAMVVALGFPFDRWLFLATCIVVLGCVASIKGELKFSWIGTTCAFTANILRAAKSTMAQYILQGKETQRFDPCSLLTWMCLASFFFAATLSAIGEGLAPWQALINTEIPMKLGAACTASCLNAAGLNFFVLIVTKELGAVGQQISGQLTHVICFFGGVVVFNEVVQLLEIVGFGVVLLGVNLYQVFDRRLKQQMAEAAKS